MLNSSTLCAAPKPYNILVLIDEKTGCNNQALGVANRIGGNIQIVRVDELDAQMKRGVLSDNAPDILISASHDTEYVAQAIKRAVGQKLFSIKLGSVDKRDYRYFDLIARYDPPVFQQTHIGDDPEKVMFTTGVAHRVTPEMVAEGVDLWETQFSKFSHPRIGVMLGGDTSPMTSFTEAMGKRLGKDLNALVQKNGGSLIISTSRRTPRKTIEALTHELSVPTYIHDWSKSQGIPHFGIMGISDYLVVTADSMSMLMEASSTGKPVYRYPVPEVEMPYHTYLCNELVRRGQAREFDGKLESWSYTPPDVASEIAARAVALLAQKKEQIFTR